ncbi:MAG: hypothetical protein R3B99_12185 [Polyangiales bacterium]
MAARSTYEPWAPNRDLRDFCAPPRGFGVGYYPNSSFVHFDVRRRSAYWVDRSGPGEAPEYVRDRAARERVDEEDAIEAQEQARAGSGEASANDASDDDA